MSFFVNNINLRHLAFIAVISMAITLTTAPVTLKAQTDDAYGLERTAARAELLVGDPAKTAQQNLNFIVGNIIKVILGFTGVLFMISLLWAGELWLTAEGNDEKIGKAKATIFHASIGILILLSAYVSTNFLVGATLKIISGIQN